MTTLVINGKRVKVGDDFKNLSPEQQNATVEEIARSMGAGAEQPGQGGYGSQIFSGLLEGATGALGFPVDAANAAVGLGMKGINAAFGTDLQPSQMPLGGSAGLRQGLAIAPTSDSAGPQVARRVSQSVGGAVVPLSGQAKTLWQAAAGIGTAIGGGIGGALSQQLFPGNVGAEIAGELLGSLGTGAAIGGIADRATRRAAEEAVPSVEKLKQQASDKFKDAHRLGVTATRPETQQLATDIRSIAQQEGLISPTGRVSEAYPKAREALRLVDDYAQGNMSVPQMQTARKVLADAAKSPDSAERRIATLMLKRFDDFTAPLSPHLAEARDLYTRAMRGDQLETLSELAGARAGQFTGSGYENALRTEYRNLDRRIVKGQERGWSPDQVDAIQNVSRGTRASNTARNIGRMAPTGPVSFMATAGLPAAVGTAAGSPLLGAGIATGASMAGYGARALATNMGIRNAEIAELLARGGQPAIGGNEEIRRIIINALLGSNAAAMER